MLHVEVHLDRSHNRLGWPWVSANPCKWCHYGPAFLWLANMWALVVIFGNSCLGAPVSSGLWAPLVNEMQDRIFCTFLWSLLHVFILFHICIPEMIYLAIHVELDYCKRNMQVRCTIFLYLWVYSWQSNFTFKALFWMLFSLLDYHYLIEVLQFRSRLQYPCIDDGHLLNIYQKYVV